MLLHSLPENKKNYHRIHVDIECECFSKSIEPVNEIFRLKFT